MKSTNLCLALGSITITTLIFLTSCKKVNDSTTLGGDLIPVVDNITTFDTTLEVEAYNGIFSLAGPDVDSLRSRASDTYFLGNITNDPVFGTTTGTIFTQLKPESYRFSFAFSKPDSLIGLDSVVLVLKYVNTFGDTTIPQSVSVYEIDQAANFQDSAYLTLKNDITWSTFLGTGMYTPQYLDDSVHTFEDNSSHQLRIKLDDAFGQRLLAYDSSTAGKNAYASDSLFNTFFKGFAIIPGGTGNGLVGIDLVNSKLSIYYKYKKGVLDTTRTDFILNSRSATSNYIQRDYSGSQLLAYQGVTTPQDYAFIQAQPGTFANIKVPGLSTLSNRIVHRAELIVKQVPGDPFLDGFMVPPTYLYLDQYDSAKSLYRAIPYELTVPDQSTGSLVTANPLFGFSPKDALDGGITVKEWRLNISRYVQNVLTKKTLAYPFRLYAPYIALDKFDIGGGVDYFSPGYVNPVTTSGRVKVYGGDATGINPNRMRLRIVYSKI